MNQYHINRERNQKFYHSSEWRKIRLYILNCFPICEVCNDEIATEVHHHININSVQGWEQRLNTDHLQALCRSCHQKHTITETKARKEGKDVQSIEERMNELNDFD